MEDLNKEVFEAFEVIKNGGIILYPTDTVWGIGCDATNEEAVKKIYDLKKRAESKSMIVLVNGDRLLYNVFSQIPEVAFDKHSGFSLNAHQGVQCHHLIFYRLLIQ